MDLNIFTFWIQFSLVLFAILVMIIAFLFSQSQKKRIERRLDQVLFEVRELNLRVTVVETRQEERMPQWHPHPMMVPQLTSEPTAKKRGRPRKAQEE
jgi:hypothetical protein